MDGLETNLKLPDLWQQEALAALKAGKDVVVDAPTGAGKTYIFELLLESGRLRGRAVYTVPTRALANDKLLEWRAKGWNVGIATGDLADNLTAPVIVATLETQKGLLLRGEGPALLVIDEYQMLGDRARGVNYELAIATAPADTRLLMLSGTVANPQEVVDWLQRLGREATLVSHKDRPVPQDEVHVEALREKVPPSVHGHWPRVVGKALKAKLGPILLFATRRRAAEQIARQLAAALPIDEALHLTAEQKRVAGDELARLLKGRIAYHHSGLSYEQRAGLVEPLAKAGQLRVVVATTGLASGINFSLRSVLITDREYRHGDEVRLLRSDELQQMFGRAGRRGMDKRGHILVLPGKPRLREGKPLHLKRSNPLEWGGILAVMRRAAEAGEDPAEAARELVARLFSRQRIALGLRDLKEKADTAPVRTVAAREAAPRPQNTVKEILNSAGDWERKRAPVRAALSHVLVYEKNRWKPALRTPQVIERFAEGSLCKLDDGEGHTYGREVKLARLGEGEQEGELVLTKWTRRHLRRLYEEESGPRTAVAARRWSLERLEEEVVPRLPQMAHGQLAGLDERGGMIVARLHFAEAPVYAFRDTKGCFLWNPPEREREHEPLPAFFGRAEASESEKGAARRAESVAELWLRLGLIETDGTPTRRGALVSFFNHGEGLALSAALEDENYAVEEICQHLANLRAGHRFDGWEGGSSRLGSVCRAAFGTLTIEGYLRKGVPPDYGDGAAEVLDEVRRNPQRRQQFKSEELRPGDIERAALEWRSLLSHVAHAPDYDWDRWRALQEAARERLARAGPSSRTCGELPDLTPDQRQRVKNYQHFD